MRIFVPREIHPGETRAPLTPATVVRLAKLGAQVEVESGIGSTIYQSDDRYREAGAAISKTAKPLWLRPTWFCDCACRPKRKSHG